MLALAVFFAAASAWLLLPQGSRSKGAQRRRQRVPTGAPTLASMAESATARGCLCAAGGGFLGQLLGGPVAAAGGAAAGAALSIWIGRLEPPSVARAREEIDGDLPLAVELLAACASVGRSPQDVLPVVGRAVGGPLSERLAEATARLSLGADPVAEWTRLSHDDQLGELGRTLLRSAEHGAPLAEGLARLAEDRRRERRTTTQLRARSVGVKAAGPLAACFLPAFMLIGVVPTVAGSFQQLFG
ncbi:MAG: type II secretion system F family protein [Nocardioidaceae bacterium]